MAYVNEDGESYKVSQVTFSQALQMVTAYSTSSECPDTSSDHVTTHNVSIYTVEIVFL